MKCPKCGYISFDHLEVCKNCGYNLVLKKYENSESQESLKKYKKVGRNIKRKMKKKLLKKKEEKEVKVQFDKHLVVLWEPDSIAAEQYKVLRTHILREYEKNGNRVFLVSSAVHGEGKTITSINLALSLAQGLHETVLLIDADLRKPSISDMCGLRNDTKGLAEYLTNGGDPSKIILKTSIPKFSLIPAGNPPDNPSELINSNNMDNLIKEVKNRYTNRLIIMDSPPLIPVTDSIILSSLADGIVIVIKALATQKEFIDEAINKIDKKEKIVGFVLNTCDDGIFKYYDSYYKYYRETKK